MYSLFPSPGVAHEQDAGRTVGEEDGHRVVAGLAEEFTRRRSGNVGSSSSNPRQIWNPSAKVIECMVLPNLPVAVREGSFRP
jgi:hypothetical protein